jgi:low affinity Fe/Cu permease
MARRRKADGSRWLERSARAVTVWTGSSQAFAGAVGVIIVWALLGPVFHFSDTWQLGINTGTTIVTFLMVFLIQNTQNRDAKAMHLKLDELLRGVEGARTSMVDLEDLSDGQSYRVFVNFDLATVLNGVSIPVLVQDFNPGGPTIGVDFVVRLLSECPNLRYLKLEEPLSASKVAAIRSATQDRVGILEGWGGLYMMELIPAGICGLMPGLGMADLLNRAFFLRKQNKSQQAFELYEKALPHIVFSLQNMELYLYTEKRLLQTRGILSNAHTRSACLTADPFTARYVEELNGRLVQALEDAGLLATKAAEENLRQGSKLA